MEKIPNGRDRYGKNGLICSLKDDYCSVMGFHNDDSSSFLLLYNRVPYRVKRLPRELKTKDDFKVSKAAKYNYNYLVGILISKITSYYHQSELTNELNVYPGHIKCLRIPKIEKNKYAKEIETLAAELKMICRGDVKDLSVPLQNQVLKLIRTIDRYIYEAYGLTEIEIGIIEQFLPIKTPLPSLKQARKTVKLLVAA